MLNYGARLYHQGLKKMENDEQRHIEALALKEQQDLDHSFHPKINLSSYYLVEDEKGRPEDKLIKKGLIAKDKHEQMRAQEEYQKQMQFSFHPSINGNSK